MHSYPPWEFAITKNSTPFVRRIHDHPPEKRFVFTAEELVRDSVPAVTSEGEDVGPLLVNVFALLLALEKQPGWWDEAEGELKRDHCRLISYAFIPVPSSTCQNCEESGRRCYRPEEMGYHPEDKELCFSNTYTPICASCRMYQPNSYRQSCNLDLNGLDPDLPRSSFVPTSNLMKGLEVAKGLWPEASVLRQLTHWSDLDERISPRGFCLNLPAGSQEALQWAEDLLRVNPDVKELLPTKRTRIQEVRYSVRLKPEIGVHPFALYPFNLSWNPSLKRTPFLDGSYHRRQLERKAARDKKKEDKKNSLVALQNQDRRIDESNREGHDDHDSHGILNDHGDDNDGTEDGNDNSCNDRDDYDLDEQPGRYDEPPDEDAGRRDDAGGRDNAGGGDNDNRNHDHEICDYSTFNDNMFDDESSNHDNLKELDELDGLSSYSVTSTLTCQPGPGGSGGSQASSAGSSVQRIGARLWRSTRLQSTARPEKASSTITLELSSLSSPLSALLCDASSRKRKISETSCIEAFADRYNLVQAIRQTLGELDFICVHDIAEYNFEDFRTNRSAVRGFRADARCGDTGEWGVDCRHYKFRNPTFLAVQLEKAIANWKWEKHCFCQPTNTGGGSSVGGIPTDDLSRAGIDDRSIARVEERSVAGPSKERNSSGGGSGTSAWQRSFAAQANSWNQATGRLGFDTANDKRHAELAKLLLAHPFLEWVLCNTPADPACSRTTRKGLPCWVLRPRGETWEGGCLYCRRDGRGLFCEQNPMSSGFWESRANDDDSGSFSRDVRETSVA